MEFSTVAYSVSEAVGLVDIEVEITYPDDYEDMDIILSVLFSTTDGSATGDHQEANCMSCMQIILWSLIESLECSYHIYI